MIFLSNCTLHKLDPSFNLCSFDCGNEDLNDFLKNDALPYQENLMAVTYLFTLDSEPNEIVCFFTVSNDGLRVDMLYNSAKKKVNKNVPRPKHMRVYPAVKIGRLGVNKKYNGKGIGTELMNFIKGWFIDNNKTGSRFILVDAYNTELVLNYYQKNKFLFLMSEEKEAEAFETTPNDLRTRIMYFDLAKLL